MSPDHSTKKWSLLNKLKKAVKKINFLLTSTYRYSQWSLASISIFCAPRTSRQRYTRHLSFNSELGIYHGCSEGALVNEESRGIKNRSLSSFRSFGRITNPGLNNDDCSYSAEDIDRRADMFIENFHRQLRMERQISLELRYCNDDSDVVLSSPENKTDDNNSRI